MAILLGLKNLYDLQAYETLSKLIVSLKNAWQSLKKKTNFSYHTKRGLKYSNKSQKVHSVIFQDTQRHAEQFMKRGLECTTCFFKKNFKYSDCIQLRLFQGLGGLNEAEGKDVGKKERWREDGGRMC